ncbi:MAG: hypothetical protein HY815_21405 [Candidatus Riflebacteria bacterium]|nr:hypothetical protein [Candidatus Riflebacteria bacterium]
MNEKRVRWATAVLVSAALVCLVRPTLSKTYVLPHVLEKSGSVPGVTNTFDTSIFMTYTGGLQLPGVGPVPGQADVDLYLFDSSSPPVAQVLGSGYQAVCQPCVVGIGATERKKRIKVDDLLSSATARGVNDPLLGYGVVVVGSSEPDAVNIQTFVVNSHTGAFDLSVFGFSPESLLSAGGLPRDTVRSVDPRTADPNALYPESTRAVPNAQAWTRIARPGTYQPSDPNALYPENPTPDPSVRSPVPIDVRRTQALDPNMPREDTHPAGGGLDHLLVADPSPPALTGLGPGTTGASSRRSPGFDGRLTGGYLDATVLGPNALGRTVIPSRETVGTPTGGTQPPPRDPVQPPCH